MENFDDLLTWRNALEHFFPHGPILDLGDEFLGDAEMDIGIEQCQANLAQRIGDIRFGETPVTPKVLESLLELIGELGKHGALEKVESEKVKVGETHPPSNRTVSG